MSNTKINKTNFPLVSVIMSVYDSVKPEYFKVALDSMINQTYSNIEIILVLDGVKRRNLIRIAGSYQKNYKVKTIKQEENLGLAKAMNLALKYVNGEFIARMDADDISHPKRIEKQTVFLLENPDIDIVGTWAIEINERGKEFFRKKMPLSHDECYRFFKKRDPVVHPSVMFRRNFLGKIELYPENTYLAEDTMLWADAFAKGCKFANIPEYLYYSRVGEDFYKRRSGLKAALEIFKCRLLVNKKLKYPPIAYIYAILYGLMRLAPSKFLKWLYKKFR